MRLSDWLSIHGMSHSQFAAKIGVHVTTVYRLCSGVHFPLGQTALAIKEATNGEVNANDFVGLERPEPRTGTRGRPRVKAEAAR